MLNFIRLGRIKANHNLTIPAESIEVNALVNVSLKKLWQLWIEERHIEKWNSASDDPHTPKAVNDFSLGGRFLWRMEAKDGSMGFDFSGTYTDIVEYEYIAYTIDDGRDVLVCFNESDGQTKISQFFQPESQNSPELQKMGWQAILDHFKTYTENL